MVEEILSDTGRPSSDSTRVKLKICDALDAHRNEHFFFNEADFSFTTVINVDSYDTVTGGVPATLTKILGKYLFLDRLGVATDRWRVVRKSREYMDRLRSGSTPSGQPEVYAWFGSKIELYPKADASGHIVRGRGSFDPGLIIKRFDTAGSAWKFYKPATTSFVIGNEVGDDYPNGADVNFWFQTPTVQQSPGYTLIRWYAEYLLFSGVWQDTTGRGDRALQRYVELRAHIEDQSFNRSAPMEVAPVDGDF